MRRLVLLLALFGSVSGAAFAQEEPQPQPTPLPSPVAEPRDIAYPGVIQLSVDATDLQRKIYQVHETIPVAGPGPMVLLYPKWLPGNHSPSGPLDQLGGLTIMGGGKRIEWTRDPVDVYAFHIDVPPGVSTLELSFQDMTPTEMRVGRVAVTPDILNVEWNATTLYPAGYFSRQINVATTLKLPEGWRFGTALEPASTQGDTTTFKTVPFNTLVDSPLLAGRYFKRIDLDPNGPVPVHLDVAADRADLLEATPEQIQAHVNLVSQAYKLFGSHHYDHYDFLLWLSDDMGGEGLEHHRSSEDGTEAGYFADWKNTVSGRDLLAHEYTHSWNGKFRRGADLWTASFNVPMRDSLLWVYEGQTQYWGFILAARAGLWTKSEALDAIAATAATYDHRVGRAWRALEDTTNDPIISRRHPTSWRSWQRSEDYYSEGQLVWFDVDTLIRERTGGKKSLDDFAKGFFGVRNGSFVTDTYTFEDVVKALNEVTPYDWTSFLRTRLDGHAASAPLDGITRGGYRLVYDDVQSSYFASNERKRKSTDLLYSLGMMLDHDGKLTEVLWDGPAFKAGLITGAQVVAVNGATYDAAKLKDAVKLAKGTTAPIELLVKADNRYRTVSIDYHAGLKYPHLERITGTPARLDEILAARK
ncbi:M61 family metallopeptidase [Caulobacter sp. S45]|uniref:M61 family metallopeptidase n=1 Tax=Caulobacter sp. S45 TaxID=1641861 RepID=UPI00131AB53C|nr:peptidase M61 [Caulobacter sp. S45]